MEKRSDGVEEYKQDARPWLVLKGLGTLERVRLSVTLRDDRYAHMFVLGLHKARVVYTPTVLYLDVIYWDLQLLKN